MGANSLFAKVAESRKSCPASPLLSIATPKSDTLSISSVLEGNSVSSEPAVAVGAKKLPLSLQKRICKTKICAHNINGRCNRGDTCSFAHSQDELQHPPDLYKTRLCERFMTTGVCIYRPSCRFAHGDSELRSTPEFYKTSMCPYYQSKKTCPAGKQCRWAHGNHELRPRTYPKNPSEAAAMLDLAKECVALATGSKDSCNVGCEALSSNESHCNKPQYEKMNAHDELWFSEMYKTLVTSCRSVGSGMDLMMSDSTKPPMKKIHSDSNMLKSCTSKSNVPCLPYSSFAPHAHPNFTGSAVKSNSYDPYDVKSVDVQQMDTAILTSPFNVPSIPFDAPEPDFTEAKYLQQFEQIASSPRFPDSRPHQRKSIAASTSTTCLFNLSALTKARSLDNELTAAALAYLPTSDYLWTNPADSSNNSTAESVSSSTKDDEIGNPSFIANVSLEDIMNQLVLSRFGSSVSFDDKTSSSFSKASVDPLGCNL